MKFIKMVISIMFCISLISCGGISSNNSETSEYIPKDPSSRDYPFAKKTALKVIDYLDNGDIEGFKKLLSKSVLLEDDVNEQLEVLFDFCEEYNVSYTQIRSSISSSSLYEGEYTYKSIRIVIEEAIVFDEESYNIDFYYILVDDDNERNIGLSELLIRDTDKSIMMRFFDEPKY